MLRRMRGMRRHVWMWRHVRVGHGRGRHVLLGQGRLRHHVGGLGNCVQWRVGVHVHGLLASLGLLLLLLSTRRSSLHPLLAGSARDLVLTGVAGRHPVVGRSHPGHPGLARPTRHHLVLTGVSRGHPVAGLAHHGHPLLAGASRHHLVLTWMTRRHPVVVLSHSRHLLARSHPRSHGSLARPHPGHSSSHWHSDIAHRHLEWDRLLSFLLSVEKSVKVDLPVGSFDWAPYFPGSSEVQSPGRVLRSSCCVSPS